MDHICLRSNLKKGLKSKLILILSFILIVQVNFLFGQNPCDHVNLKKWKRDNDGCKYRSIKLAECLIRDYELVGKKKNEVLAILGPPNSQTMIDDYIYCQYITESRCKKRSNKELLSVLKVLFKTDPYGVVKMDSYTFLIF